MTSGSNNKGSSADLTSISTLKAFQFLDTATKVLLTKKVVKLEFSPGEKVVCRSNKANDVYFLITGQIRVSTFSLEGKEIQFEDLEQGEMFGELAAIDDGNRSGDCISLTHSTVAKMSQVDFLHAIDTYPKFNRYVLSRLTGMLRSQLGRVVEFSSHTVKDRLRCELIRLAVRQGELTNNIITIKNPPTHADIASRIGTHREAVTRELNRLQSIGIITWTRTEHSIRDLDALKLSVVDR